MRGALLLTLLLAVASATSCTKDECVELKFGIHDFGSFTHTAPTKFTVNGDEVDLTSEHVMFRPGTLNIVATMHTSEPTMTNIRCVASHKRGEHQQSEDASIALEGKAGDRFMCRVFTFPTTGGEVSKRGAPSPPDVVIAKAVGSDTAEVGSDEIYEWSLTVTNARAGAETPTAFNLVVTDEVDPRLQVVSFSPDSSIANCSATNPNPGALVGQNIRCEARSLASGQSFTITISFRSPAALAPGENDTITNFGLVTTDPVDAQLSNNRDPAFVVLKAVANLVIETCCSNNITAGRTDPTPWNTTVSNRGLSKAFNVQAQIWVPAVFDLTGGVITPVPDPISGPFGATCVPAALGVVPPPQVPNAFGGLFNRWNCTGFDLEKDQSLIFSYSATVAANVGGPNGNTTSIYSSVASDTEDNLLPNDDIHPVMILLSADVRVGKSSNFLVYAGQNATYAMSVVNGGPSFSFNVVLRDEILLPFRAVGFSTTQGNCSATATSTSQGFLNFITCDIGDVAPSTFNNPQSVNLTILVNVPPETPATISDREQRFDGSNAYNNTAFVQATTTDPDIPNNQDPAFYNVIDLVDVSIVKRCQQGTLVGGTGNYSFFIEVYNTGPSVARGIVITDSIPTDFTNLNVVVEQKPANADLICTLTENNLRCELSEPLGPAPIGASAPIRIRIDFDVRFEVAVDGLVPNTAFVTTTATEERITSNNQFTCQTRLQRPPDVSVFKTSNVTEILTDDDTRTYGYQITITNNGPGSASNVNVIDNVPTAFIASAQNGFFSNINLPGLTATFADVCLPQSSGNTLNCTVPSMPVGDITITIPFTVPLDSPAGIVENCANVTAALDRDTTNNSWCANITVSTGTRLIVTKSSTRNGDCVASNGIRLIAGADNTDFNFTIDTFNEGPAVARSVSLEDVLQDPFTLRPGAPLAVFSVTRIVPLQPDTPLDVTLCTVTANGNGEVNCQFGDMQVGETIRVVFGFSVASSVRPGLYSNTATARTQTFQASNSTAIFVLPVRVCNEWVMGIEKSGETKVVAGQSASATGPYSYNLAISNNGPSDAEDPVVRDLLPTYFTALNFAITPNLNNDAFCTISTATGGRSYVECEFPGVYAVGRIETVTILFSVAEDAPEGSVINTGVVESPPDVPREDNHTTVIDNIVDLIITKSGPSEPVCAGGSTADYVITVVNAGPSRAYDVIVVDTLPFPTMQLAGAVVTSGTNADGPVANDLCSSSSAGVITCNFGALKPATVAPANQVIITYSLFVPQSERANLIEGVNNTAVASSGCSSDPNSLGQPCVRNVEESDITSNTVVFNTKICAFADLSITKRANQAVYVAGQLNQQFEFYLDVTNVGPADAYNVRVNDTNFVGGTITNVVSDAGAACTLSPPSCVYPSMIVGATDLITVSFTVGSQQTCGPYENRGVIASDTDEPNPNIFPNESIIPVPIEARHDLQVRKYGPTNATAGGASSQFALSVFNDGPSQATNVVFVDVVPWPLMVTGAVTNRTGTTCDVAATVVGQDTVVRCELGNIDTQDQVNVTISFAVDTNADLGTLMMVTNTASAFSSPVAGQTCDNVNPDDPVSGSTCEFEINVQNNCDDWNVDLLCSTDLMINKTDFRTTVTAGDGILYNYTTYVWNAGVSTARNVKVIDSPFPSLYFDLIGVPTVGLGPGSTPCSIGATGFECEIGDLVAGGEVYIYANYRVKNNAPSGVAANTVTVTTSCREVSTNNTFTDFTEVLNAADMGIVKDDCVEEVCAGENMDTTFVLTVTNTNGPSRGLDVVVTDTVPAIYQVQGLPVVTGYTEGASCSGEQLDNNLGYALTCTWPEFPVGAVGYISIKYRVDSATPAGMATNCATVNNTLRDDNQENNHDCDTNVICNKADLEVTKFLRGVDDDKCVVAGDNTPVFYEVLVRNLGPSTSRAVEVYESFPAGVTVLQSSLPASCRNEPVGSQNYTCTIPPPHGPDMASGSNFTFAFDIVIGASVPAGEIRNNVTVWSPVTPDPDLCNNNATDVSLVCIVTDLGVTKNDGVTNLTAGELDADGNPVVYTYVIVGTNNGPSDAVDIIFNDVWPFETPGFIPMPPQTPEGLVCVPVASPMGWRCTMASLPAGQSVSWNISYTVDPCATACEYCNTVTIASPSPEGDNVLSNIAQDCNTVRAEADLSVCKSDGVNMVTAGELDQNGNPLEITYSIVVTNNGPSCAEKVNLLDRYPPQVNQLNYQIVDGPQFGSCVPVNLPGHPSSFSCNLLTLRPGESRVITSTYTVPSNVTTCSVTNVANVNSLITFDPRQCNNDFRDTNALVEKANLTISKISTANTIATSFTGNNTFSIRVWNRGPSYARDVILTDQWPSGLVQYRQAITVTGINGSQAAIMSTGGDITVNLGDLAPGESFAKTVHIPYSLMANMAPGFIYNRASVFSPTDTECRHAVHTTEVVAGVAKRAPEARATRQAARTAPAHKSFEFHMPTQKPTEAPVAVNVNLPSARVTVHAQRVSATKFNVQVSNPNTDAVRLAAMQMRVASPTGIPHAIDMTAQSADVVSTTCDSVLSRRFGKNWELKCHFELSEPVASDADIMILVSGSSRSVKGFAPAKGSLHMKK